MNIGERLKEEREKLVLDQEAFAAIGGASRHSQIDWEKGKSFPNAKALAAWASAGADVQYILTGQHSANALPPDELALIAGYRALDARGKAGVLGMIGGLTQPNNVSQQFNAPVKQVAGGNIVNKKLKP